MNEAYEGVPMVQRIIDRQATRILELENALKSTIDQMRQAEKLFRDDQEYRAVLARAGQVLIARPVSVAPCGWQFGDCSGYCSVCGNNPELESEVQE